MSHSAPSILNEKLEIYKSYVKKNGYYYHYKTPNKFYKVIDFAVKEDTEKNMRNISIIGTS